MTPAAQRSNIWFRVIKTWGRGSVVWPRLPGATGERWAARAGKTPGKWRQQAELPPPPLSVPQLSELSSVTPPGTGRRWCLLWTVTADQMPVSSGDAWAARPLQETRSPRLDRAGRRPGTGNRNSYPGWVTPASRRTWDPLRSHPRPRHSQCPRSECMSLQPGSSCPAAGSSSTETSASASRGSERSTSIPAGAWHDSHR